MQQFTVPQFIDVEDKIIGPITARQFVIMLFSFMVVAVIFKFFDFSFFLVVGGMIIINAIVFAFVRVNGRPFHFFVLNFVQTVKRPSLRIWNYASVKYKIEKDFEETKINVVEKKHKQMNSTRLAELALIVDTQGAYRGISNNKKIKINNQSLQIDEASTQENELLKSDQR